jgi:hypothetical protein
MDTIGQLHPHRGYILDFGARYIQPESSWVGCFNVYEDGRTIHRVDRTGVPGNKQDAENQALKDGKEYIDTLPALPIDAVPRR